MPRPMDNPAFRNRITRPLISLGAPPDDDPKLDLWYEIEANGYRQMKIGAEDTDGYEAAKVLEAACRDMAEEIRSQRRDARAKHASSAHNPRRPAEAPVCLGPQQEGDKVRYRSTQRRRGGIARTGDLVNVTYTGPAQIVAILTHALDSVTVVTSLRCRLQADATVQVEVTCYRPGPVGKRGPR